MVNSNWELETDILVAGCGYAGAAAAIFAHDAGNRVLLLEKMPNPGGLSMLSGGFAVICDDPNEAVTYLKHTCGGRTGGDVLWAFAEGMTWLPDFYRELAKANGAQVEVRRRRGATYPLPGWETFGEIYVPAIPNFTGFPWGKGMRGGARLFKILYDNLRLRQVNMHCGMTVRRVLTNGIGEVSGVEASYNGRPLSIKARKGVVLATGGFEFDEELKDHFVQAKPVYGIYRGNTGDGIRMAQQVGAKLWHMWHIHSGYGFKYDEFPIAFRTMISGTRRPDRTMPWILLDKRGKRFMNEYPPAIQDSSIRALEYFDADAQDYPRIPCYLIFDERGRKLGPIGFCPINDPDISYSWSEDNSQEIERGWVKRTETIRHLAEIIGVDPDAVQESVIRWNYLCEKGADTDFGRLPGTMIPIKEPPYYGMQAWPIVSNTQGGPEHNSRQQILNVEGKPIPRLYAAGELGSLFGHLYLEAGNVAECFVGARIAVEDACGLEAW